MTPVLDFGSNMASDFMDKTALRGCHHCDFLLISALS